jgi:hypothetical protein
MGISRERVGSISHEDLYMRKVTKLVLLLHENIPAHRALSSQKKLAHLGFQRLDYPTYSPGLAASDYHLFHGLKKQLKSLVQRGSQCCRIDLVGRRNF